MRYLPVLRVLIKQSMVGRRFKDRGGVDMWDEEDRYKKEVPRCGLEALEHVCICASSRGRRGKPEGHGPELCKNRASYMLSDNRTLVS